MKVITSGDKIALFRLWFQGREDVIARRWESPRTGKSGYSPVCRNEWRRPFCQKGRIASACGKCRYFAGTGLSDAMLLDHFRGRHVLGIYPLLSDHTCRVLVADFDDHTGDRNPLKDVQAFYEVCMVQDLPGHVIRSRSGNGFHVWFFFEKPVPAWKARCVGIALLREAEIIGPETDISSFDRLFPAQDRISGKGFGNLVALPFQGNAVRKDNTLFLDPDTGFERSFTKQWPTLMCMKTIRESALDALVEEWELEPEILLPEPAVPHQWPVIFHPADFERIAQNCRFVAHCRDHAQILAEPDWYILLTLAARCRDGCRLAHRLSAPYPRYSFAETEAKITRALTCTGPYLCRTIERINGTYCKTCIHRGRMRSPLVLGRKVVTEEYSDRNKMPVQDVQSCPA